MVIVRLFLKPAGIEDASFSAFCVTYLDRLWSNLTHYAAHWGCPLFHFDRILSSFRLRVCVVVVLGDLR